ncbi:MAG: gamma-glutamyltransferase [Alphaproteobacteria bacterium]|nr:gamma-glutamyltransferase [Alphaproteobacteria bacterium]
MRRLFVLLAVLAVAGCGGPSSRLEAGLGHVEALPAENWAAGAMVAAANPHAVEAGLEILRKGGSAVDAALAVQAVLGLVEPQSSGLGGGAFLLHYDAATGDVTAYDGREMAPAGATPALFLKDGQPEDFVEAVRSGRSVGVPGAVAVLMLAYQDRNHGRLGVAADFEPAMRLATEGFQVSQRMNAVIGMVASFGPLPPDAASYLTTDGTTPLPVGYVLKNPAYADTLRKISELGLAGFYRGPVAEAIVAAVHRGNDPGSLTLDDLGGYEARKLEPICEPYRVYLVCGMGPPSSGGLGVLNALGILSHFDMAKAGNSAEGWHLMIEAMRLAYADRDKYAADDRFVDVPTAGLLDGTYLKGRAALIQADKALPNAEAGMPPGAEKRASDETGGWTGTSHFVVVDNAGNVVSMTTTVEGPFGSGRMAAGFFLNNQLTDFSFMPTGPDGTPVANAVAAGKKPRSSMAPTIVFKDGRFRLAAGSPGGNAIIAYVLKTLVATLDWNMTPQDAVSLPNVVARGPVIIEQSFDPAIRAALERMGHQISDARAGEASGLHAIELDDSGHLVGGADPRREGQARAP